MLGIPSGLSFLICGWEWLQLRLFPVPPNAPYQGTGNQVVDFLLRSVEWGTSLLQKLGNVLEFFLGVLALLSLAALGIAAFLFWTARGIEFGRTWARVCGVLVALLTLFASWVLVSAAPRPVPYAIGAIFAGSAIYALWVLGWRFAQ